jgi:hypothetical protein
MVYVIYCESNPDFKATVLEKAIAKAGPYRRMTDNLWIFEANTVPKELEAVIKSFQVKSFIAPLHPNGPSGGNLVAAEKEKRKNLYIIHCNLLKAAEKEKLEKIIEDAGPNRKFTDDLWCIAAYTMPENLESFLKSLNVISFAAPLHPDAQCGGNFLAEDAEWLVLHSSKSLQ